MKDTKGVRQVLEELIGQAIGEASMCWSGTPKGVFESERAVKLTDKTVAALLEIMLGMLPERRDMADMRGLGQIGNEGWNEARTLMEQNIRGGFNNG